MIVSMIGVITKTQIWMIIIAITSVGLGLVFILLGVVVALTTEIEQHKPDKEIVKGMNYGPLLIVCKVQKIFGLAAQASSCWASRSSLL